MSFAENLAAGVLVLASTTACATPPVAAGLTATMEASRDERLLAVPMADYVIGHQDRSNTGYIVEMVPKGQTVQDWTDRVTTHMFVRLQATSGQFADYMVSTWTRGCPGGTSTKPEEISLNGYVSHRWRSTCPLDQKTSKPESTMFLAVQGKKILYDIQVATRAVATAEWEQHATAYLETVILCDKRDSAHPCPPGYTAR